jgi:hypothetical protein
LASGPRESGVDKREIPTAKKVYWHGWKHSANHETETDHPVYERVAKDVSLDFQNSWKIGISTEAEADWNFEHGSSIRQDILLNIYSS